jgi:hypothetical protein
MHRISFEAFEACKYLAHGEATLPFESELF